MNLTPLLLILLFSNSPEVSPMETMNRCAEPYVRLVLALGHHDSDYVDAYYGPEEWRPAEKQPLDQIRDNAKTLQNRLAALKVPASDREASFRHLFMQRQLQALLFRIDMLEGKKHSFDVETRNLYDAVSPSWPESHYRDLIGELEALVPGKGELAPRLEAYRKQFVIPPDRLDDVFQTAIRAARERTARYIELPKNENFVVEYVKDKPWSGYNWYKGNNYSLIQVNTDLPIQIDRAINLACHEGYPGHHVFNVLLETHLVKKKGWHEFSVYPLFSPQSLIAEGSANFGIHVAFPEKDRLAFEKEVLFPKAGLDASQVETYYRILDVSGKLAYAGNEAARNYLDGKFSREKTIEWLMDYALYSRKRAEQRLSFIDKYRGYVINYNLGQDLVADHVKVLGGTEDQPQKRWEIFEELLSLPILPSQLKK